MNMHFQATSFALVLTFLLVLPCSSAQEKSPAVTGQDLKDAKEAIWKKDWFPEETRDRLEQVLGAFALADHARENTDPSEAFATWTEAIKWSDSAREWHLSRSILAEMEARYVLPSDASKKWYQNLIRETDLGARLAELVDLLATDILDNTFSGNPEDWKPIHRLLTKRLEESQNSATLFSCRDSMKQIENRLDLLQKDKTAFWLGISEIVKSNDVEAGVKQFADALNEDISKPASKWSGKDFSFENAKTLLAALVDHNDPNARKAAILIFQSIIDQLSYDQIIELQDVCYSLTHELSDDFSLPYYDHRHNPGQEVRMDVLKTQKGRRNVRFNKDDKAWEVNDECWFDYIQMPVTNTVHDIEMTVTKIPGFFKFRYGAYNSLRVGFHEVEKDRIRLKHERAYGGSKRNKRSKDTFAYGDRIKLTVFTMCGRQFVIINQKYASERTLDNVWTSHQFVCEGGTKLKLHKSTLRNWLVGDRERMIRTFGDHSSLRCTRKSSIDWNRDELIRYIKENNAHSRKLTTPEEKPFVNEIGIVMQPIAPGEFQHGDVTFKLAKTFWMSQHEITQLQWEQVMGSNPASIQGNAHFPVDNMSYQDAVKFCKRLTTREKSKRALPKGFIYRLPTEAEWEYVCRAGKEKPFSVEEDGFWHRETAEARYHAVGTSSPNPFGIYDMHGNVEEFTFDQYVKLPTDAKGVRIDPKNPPDEKDDHISIRGGSWCILKADCASDKRKTGLMERCPYRGLRVALVPVEE